MIDKSGKIITFYSYKGGAGRSMAVSNVAWILASNGCDVLLIDWDLEAPGLHRYLRPFLVDPELTSSPGVIDFVWDAARVNVTPADKSQATSLSAEFPSLEDYVVGLDWDFHANGSISFIPAGRQEENYAQRVNTFSWDNFYERLGGGKLLQAEIDALRKSYDFILIDSRTGVSDTSGICTVQLPDMLVVFFTLNLQSINGAAAVASSVRAQRGVLFPIYPVPTRLENGEQAKLKSATAYARRTFAPLLLHVQSDRSKVVLDEQIEYWHEVETPYISFYAFEEVPAAFMEERGSLRGVLAPTERLTARISDQRVTALKPETDELRKRVVAAYEFRENEDGSEIDRNNEGSQRQQLFISYRHESPEHTRAVRRLGELLRQANIPVALDQFYLDEHPGGPDQGWPGWLEDCANNSACVLIIASEGWFAAYERAAPPGLGLGAGTEAPLFRQWLYDEAGDNPRVRLAFLHDVPAQQVPVRLHAWHQFRPFDNDDQLNQLVRWAASSLKINNIELPTVRWPEPLEFRPNLADRLTDWSAIVELLAGRSRERILLFEGPSGFGKSVLLRQAVEYARKLGVPVAALDFKGSGLDIETILGQFDLDLNQSLPNFSKDGATKTHLLRRDLRGLRQPILVIFDTYEDCVGNKRVVDWLDQQLLSEVETSLALVVIIAGQQVPDYRRTRWRDLVRYLRLGPITEIVHWIPWIEQNYPDFLDKRVDLNTLILAAEGKPALMSNLSETISKSSM